MIIIQSPTPSLSQSLSFYERLQFTKIKSDQKNLFCEGNLLIEINEEGTARLEIKLFSNSINVDEIEQHACFLKTNDGMIVTDYSGVWIRILNDDQKNMYPMIESKTSSLGNYGGLSIETPDMAHSLKLWQLLGFEPYMGKVEQGWLSLKNENEDVISLMAPFMCPHLFFNPSLTYFNGKKNLEIINEIRSKEIDIAEEITQFNDKGIVDNIIMRDPGGLGMFVFSDEA